MDPLALYERHERLIHSIFKSRIKIQILLTLLLKDSSLAEIRKVTGSASQAIIPKIRSLESLALVESAAYNYRLTPLGIVVADTLAGYVDLMGGIGEHQEFWTTHDLSGIPQKFLARIGDLKSADVKCDTTVDMFSVYTHYLEILKDPAYIHGLSSVASPGLAQFLSGKVTAGVQVELVVSAEVVSLLQQEPYYHYMENLMSFRNFGVWVTKEPIGVGLTVTDKYLSLGLFKKGTNLYDSATDLFSSDRAAVTWGEELFRYHKKRSLPLVFDTPP